MHQISHAEFGGLVIAILSCTEVLPELTNMLSAIILILLHIQAYLERDGRHMLVWRHEAF